MVAAGVGIQRCKRPVLVGDSVDLVYFKHVSKVPC